MKLIFRSIISIIFIIGLTLSPTSTSKSCGYNVDIEDIRVALFNPTVIGKGQYSQLFYNYNYWSDYEYDYSKDYKRNCKEWQSELGEHVKLEDIYTILYEVNQDTFLMAHLDGTLKEMYPNNTFVSTLLKKKNQPILDYLKVAISIEFSHFADHDPWEFGYEASNLHYNRFKAWFDIIDNIQELGVPSSDFLKERYGYQLVVNYRYAGYYEKCVDAFERYLKDSQSILKSWAYVHVGHAYWKLNKYPASNLAFARSFKGCESKKARAVDGFMDDYLDETLAFTTTNEDKAAIYAVAQANYPGKSLDKIQKIIQYQPDFKDLPLLVHREINKIEDWLLTPFLSGHKSTFEVSWEQNPEYEYTASYMDAETTMNDFDARNAYYTHKNFQKDLEYLKTLRNELIKIKDRNEEFKDFYALAIAHLYFLDFQPQKALSYINQVNSTNQEIVAQKHIQQIVTIAQSENILLPNIQAKIFQSLNWLQANQDLLDRPYRTISQLNLYLSRLFYQKGNVAFAGLLFAQSTHTIKTGGGNYGFYSTVAFFDKYGTIQDIDQVFDLMKQSNKSNFEKYLLYNIRILDRAIWSGDIAHADPWYLDSELMKVEHPQTVLETVSSTYQLLRDTMQRNLKYRLLDVQGVLAFRQNRLAKAKSIFQQLPEGYWKKLGYFDYYLDDPFEDHLSLPRKGEHKIQDYATDKYEIVSRMLRLSKSNDPDSLYVLANAYYNCSYWGDTWMMFSYGRYPDEWKNINDYHNGFSFYPNAQKYENVYYRQNRALEWYKKVRKHSKASLELKAQALYMMGWIDKNQKKWEYRKVDDDREYDPYASHYHVLLKKNFATADNYRALMSCIWIDED